MHENFPIIGGGPAGAAAALAVLRNGGRPLIYEKSAFPRHKLCGEFFSPEALPALEEIGAAEGFLRLKPARVTHAELHFARSSRRFSLPEPAYGLSRYAFDDFLLRLAVERSAELRHEQATNPASPAVLATGRSVASTRGRRTFGFKAHFSGPANNAVELYFFPGGYCGVNPIEGGKTNVCGLAREDLLGRHGFRVERLIESLPRLKERLAPLAQENRWRVSGPLRYGLAHDAEDSLLRIGDAACFVDPFTGTGLLAAVQTGIWAGAALLRAAQGTPWSSCCSWHRRRCRSFFRRELVMATVIRRLLSLGWAESLTGLLPGSLLFRLTRPQA